MALSLTGCTHEGPHTGCDEGSLNLLFTYDGNTVGFDQTIAEDIELYLYDGQGKKMDAGVVKKLLSKGRVHYRDLHSRKTGKQYEATIVLADPGDGYVKFNLEFPQR